VDDFCGTHRCYPVRGYDEQILGCGGFERPRFLSIAWFWRQIAVVAH
jgi:hypothetical protein